MSDFIPSPDTAFSAFANALVTTLKVDPTSYGLTTEEITELDNELTAWDTSFDTLYQARDAARAATVDKDARREALEAKIRVINKQVQADPSVTNTQRADAGLPVYSTTRNPVAVPTTAPMVHLEAANVQQHVFRFTSAVDAHANVRPTGVKSIQLFGAFDTAPVSDSDFELLGSTTRMNATLNFPISDAGKSIWYRFRYLNTKDQPGPWTTTLAATILK
jgi:hypothetical protein